MIERYLTQTQFTSYDDFCKNLHINTPERFNFAYDVVDRMAAGEPDRPALLWTDETGAERGFTFGEMSALSDRTGACVRCLGRGPGARGGPRGEDRPQRPGAPRGGPKPRPTF